MLFNLNTDILMWLYRLATRSEVLRQVTVFLAQRLDWIVIVCVGVFILFHRHRISGVTRRAHFTARLSEMLMIFLTTSTAWLVVSLMKYNIESPRPFLTLPITPLFIHGGIDSFPSGHATFFMALAVAVGLYHRWLGWVLAGVAVIIGISRVAAGVHYPIDILVGFVLGGGLAYGLHHIFRKVQGSATEHK